MKPGDERAGARRPRGASQEAAPAAGQEVAALESVLAETVSFFHRLRLVAEQIHQQGELTAGKRGVLRSLDRLGPQTVPQMARARPATRQHIQTLVNLLLAEGLIELTDNPAHKRSRLVHLTLRGREFVGMMNRREAELLSALGVQIPEEELRAVAATLRELRELFESDRWQRVVRDQRQ
jgi:DNA-binding MarR family transcriptional regulator